MKRSSDNGDDRGGRGGKGHGRSKGGGKSGGKGSGGGISIVGLGTPRKYAFKVLCADPLAANLIGKEGKTRAAIEEETGSSVWISKRDELFPDPDFRLLILHADEPSQVLAALDSVVPRLQEVAERDRESGDGKSPLIGKEPGEYVFHAALPSLIRGKLIGTKGANIQDLRERTGAKIFVDNDAFSGHHATRIIGTPEKIKEVLRIVCEFVNEVADQEEFARWIVCQPDASGAGQDRHRSPPRDRERDRHRDAPKEREREPPRHQDGPRNRDNRNQRGRRGNREDRSRSPRGRNGDRRDFPRVPDGPPLEVMGQMTSNFPPGSVEQEHSIQFEMPAGEFDEEVRRFVEDRTGTHLSINEAIPDDPDQRYELIQIVGPLLSIYLAHFLIMQQIHDRRAAESASQDAPDVSLLRAQVEQLQKQLQLVTGAGGSGKGGGGGRRSRGRR